MTVTSDRPRAGAVSTGVVRAMVEDAAKHGYGPAYRDATHALGIFGDPAQTQPGTFEHAGTDVRIVPCVSALAVRSALLSHAGPGWLVVVTDRTEQDLGAGILAHLAGNKLRTPDPWEAVAQQFSATGLEAALYAKESWGFAQGLLAARPATGWPPAPAGALTRDHALGAVARERLAVPARSLDALGVLRWTTDLTVPALIADLRQEAGDEVVDAAVDWICAGAGVTAAPVRELVRRGELHDAVPLGLVAAVLTDVPTGESHTAQLALARLAHRWGGTTLTEQTLTAWSAAATTVAGDLIGERQHAEVTRRLLARGDELLAEAGATGLARRSAVLPAGLAARLQAVAHELRTAASDGPAGPVTDAWAAASNHLLSGADDVLRAVHAGVRLVSWLRSDRPSPTSLAGLAQRQAAGDAWVDAAVNDAYTGVADPVVAESLGAVLDAVRKVRDEHDRAFADALARATRDEDGAADGYLETDGQRVWLLEHVLRRVVVPLAQEDPTLLLVLDGMSTGVATEVVEDIRASGGTWVEALLPGAASRSCALALLPSLTEVSRASLLTGTLTTGGQDKERKGYVELTGALGLPSVLFHKKPLDTSRAGFALADDVAAAIGDTDRRLVTCVLNTIDDALDRSDPGGTTWTADAVKHLRPLLDQALLAGRRVVLTADHGHVVERREGQQKPHPTISSARSRSADLAPAGGEVLVTGPRVLDHDGSAVLAVDERLRYGPLKAGYHGGASPAEVVVPLVVLTPGNKPSTLKPARSQKPAWWEPTAQDGVAPAPVAQQPEASADGALFDKHFGTAAPAATAQLSAAVVGSETYGTQREISRRVSLSDEHVGSALDALAAASGSRLPTAALADVLALPPSRMRGAVAQLQQLLNVEGYPVVRTDAGTVVLDEPLLREQFGMA